MTVNSSYGKDATPPVSYIRALLPIAVVSASSRLPCRVTSKWDMLNGKAHTLKLRTVGVKSLVLSAINCDFLGLRSTAAKLYIFLLTAVPYSNTAYCQRCQCRTAIQLTASATPNFNQFSCSLNSLYSNSFPRSPRAGLDLQQGGPATDLYAKSERFVTWAWTGRVSLYSRQIVVHMQQSDR